MTDVYHKSTLSNGLRLITVPMPGVDSVTVMIMVGAGSRYETKRINGISHFLEHVAFKGTKKRPSSLIISSIIDGLGGEFNAFTSKDHTGYYIKSHVKHTELLFDVLSDMLLNSLLADEEIEREKGVIVEEINMYEDTPARKIGELFEVLLYGDQPLGWDIAGTAETVRSFKGNDFRDYMKAWYRPNNSVIVVAGGLNNLPLRSDHVGAPQGQAITQLTEKWLGNWTQDSIKSPLTSRDTQTKPSLLVKHKDTNQAHIAIGFRAYPIDHPKRYAMSVLSAILGGGMSSRLFIQVRERKGLAYYVRSGAERYTDVGHFATLAGVDIKRIDDAIKVILEEHAKIRDGKEPITKEELTKSKEMIKGRLTLELEDSQVVAGMYATEEIIENKIRTPKQIIEKIEAVTIDEINEVTKDVFNEKTLNLAVIGPFKEEERFRKLLSV